MNVLHLHKKMQKKYLYSFFPDTVIFEISYIVTCDKWPINILRFHDPFRNICYNIESSIHSNSIVYVASTS